MLRFFSLNRRGVTGFLVGLVLLALTLVCIAGAASSSSSAKVSAHLTATTLASSQAGSVKLVYRFSKPSKSFAYRLSFRKGSKWQVVKSVKRTGYFKGSKTMTVKKLFVGKPLKLGSYRLKLSVGKSSKLLGFEVVKVVPAIAAGSFHTCALLSSGIVECWGQNNHGQVGGDLPYRSSAAQVGGITNAVSIGAGSYHTCAVLSNGTIKCWGENQYGALGDGTTAHRTSPVRVSGITNAIQVSAGFANTCALLSDGTISCWGSGKATPARVPGISKAVQISVGGDHTCALLANGTAKCLGGNSDGQLGDGTTTNRSTPVQVKRISNAVQLSAYVGTYYIAWVTMLGVPIGGSHTCAVLVDGTVKCWGADGNGELGDGKATPGLGVHRTTPVRVSGISNAIQVSAGFDHTCSLLPGRKIKCWGSGFGSAPASVVGIP